EERPAVVQFQTLRQESLSRGLRRVKCRPQAELLPVAPVDPVEAAREVCLNGGLDHLRQARQADESLLIPAADQGLSPGREEDAEAILRRACRHPLDETRQRPAVDLQLLGRFATLGEGTVGAVVVAA